MVNVFLFIVELLINIHYNIYVINEGYKIHRWYMQRKININDKVNLIFTTRGKITDV